MQHAMLKGSIRHRSTLARTCHPHGSFVCLIFCHLCPTFSARLQVAPFHPYNWSRISPHRKATGYFISLVVLLISLSKPVLYCHRCRDVTQQYHRFVCDYLSELRRDFLASIGITYAVFRIAKSRLRGFGEIC